MINKRDTVHEEARVRLERGDYAGAGRSYRRILRHRPADAEALYVLGTLQLREGRAEEAINLICRALDSGQVRDPAVLESLGTAHLMMGAADVAERELREAITAGGTRAVLHMRLGMALAALGRLDEAEAALRVAQQQDPWDVDIRINLGNVLSGRGRTDEALECFHRARELDSKHVQVLYNIGTLHREAGRFEEAVDAYLQVLAITPEHTEALNNLGTIRERMGEVDEAVNLYKKVLAIEPSNAHAHSNLASAFRKQGLLEQAAQSCRKALNLQPGFVDALVNLGGVFAEQGQVEAARHAYQQAWKIAPADPEARCRYGMLGLAIGEFRDSWLHYQARASRRHVLQAIGSLDSELPDDIEGKTILVVGEQGIGDELFFLRCATVLKQRKARLICVCDPKIRTLLERTGLFDILVTYGESLPPRDLTFVAGDLPMVLSRGQTAADPSSLKPLQLTPMPARVHRMQSHLARIGSPPYMAVTWRSGTRVSDQRTWREGFLSKEVPLDTLAAAVQGYPGSIISLQRNPDPDETGRLEALLATRVYDASAVNADLEDMLALLGLLDEYVGVSNANMHLLAGLGGRARVLVPNPAEWRWMATGTESPWFPRFKVYRQSNDRTWDNAVASLRADLPGAEHG